MVPARNTVTKLREKPIDIRRIMFLWSEEWLKTIEVEPAATQKEIESTVSVGLALGRERNTLRYRHCNTALTCELAQVSRLALDNHEELLSYYRTMLKSFRPSRINWTAIAVSKRPIMRIRMRMPVSPK